jgi:hypothetical protein
MVIGFDLDKVFIDYPPLVPAFVIDWLYKNHNHKLSYRIPTHPLEIFIRNLSHIDFLRPPIQANIAFLKSLHNTHQHSLHLISSRYNFLVPQTEKLLKKYGIYDCFTSINLNTQNEQAHLFKLRILRHLQADVFIDDDLQLLDYLRDTGLTTKLLHLAPGISLEQLFNQT